MGASKNDLQSREMFNLFAGDRMATVMGYLSNVPAGGFTVFPLIGAYVKWVLLICFYHLNENNDIGQQREVWSCGGTWTRMAAMTTW